MIEPYSPEFGRSWDRERDPIPAVCRDTTYGFEWGPMRVERLAHIEGRGFTLSVNTDHGEIQVYVSEAGRAVRAFVPGKGELT